MRFLLVALQALLLCSVSITMAYADCDKAAYMNREYSLECLHTLPEEGLPASVTLQDGAFEASAKMGALYAEVHEVTCADLDDDGKQEALVELFCGLRGANYVLVEGHIFKVGDSAPEASLADERVQADYKRFYPESEPWNLQEVVVRDGGVEAQFYADGPHCCPEREVRMRYDLEGGELALEGEPEVRGVE